MSLRLDAAGEYAYVLANLGTAFTIIGKFYVVTDTDTSAPLFMTSDGAAAFALAGLSIDGMTPRISTSAGMTEGASAVNTAQWYHGAYVRNGSSHIFYIDGNSFVTRTDSVTVNMAALILGGGAALRP